MVAFGDFLRRHAGEQFLKESNCRFIPTVGRHTSPFVGFYIVFGSASAERVQHRDMRLCFMMLLLSSSFEPAQGFEIVLRHTRSQEIHFTTVKLCLHIARFGFLQDLLHGRCFKIVDRELDLICQLERTLLQRTYG